MTNGSPMKLILGFSVPLLFGFLFQQFYNLMDTLIVGRFLGVDDLAAVGSTGSVNFLIIGFCMGVCNGFAFVPVFGYVAACFASPVAWIFADAFLFPAYFHVLKKKKKMLYK